MSWARGPLFISSTGTAVNCLNSKECGILQAKNKAFIYVPSFENVVNLICPVTPNDITLVGIVPCSRETRSYFINLWFFPLPNDLIILNIHLSIVFYPMDIIISDSCDIFYRSWLLTTSWRSCGHNFVLQKKLCIRARVHSNHLESFTFIFMCVSAT